MTNRAYGHVEQRKDATVVYVGVDDVPTSPKDNRTPMQILRESFEHGRFLSQMGGGKILHIEESPHHNHVCDFWKLKLTRAARGNIFMQRQCASRGDEFKGCYKVETFEMLPEAKARQRFSELRHAV